MKICIVLAALVAVCFAEKIEEGRSDRQLLYHPAGQQLYPSINEQQLYQYLINAAKNQQYRMGFGAGSTTTNTVQTTTTVTSTINITCTVSTTACASGRRRRHILSGLLEQFDDIQPSAVHP